jgi:hypothetical protein
LAGPLDKFGNRSFFHFCEGPNCWWGCTFDIGAAKQYCSRSSPYGSFVLDNFGFEYTEYIEGKEVVKRQTGSLFIKCRENYD